MNEFPFLMFFSSSGRQASMRAFSAAVILPTGWILLTPSGCITEKDDYQQGGSRGVGERRGGRTPSSMLDEKNSRSDLPSSSLRALPEAGSASRETNEGETSPFSPL